MIQNSVDTTGCIGKFPRPVQSLPPHPTHVLHVLPEFLYAQANILFIYYFTFNKYCTNVALLGSVPHLLMYPEVSPQKHVQSILVLHDLPSSSHCPPFPLKGRAEARAPEALSLPESCVQTFLAPRAQLSCQLPLSNL